MSLFDHNLSIKEISVGKSSEDKNYIQFPVYLILTDWIVPFNIYLKLLDANHDTTYVCACKKDFVFESIWKYKLDQLNINHLYHHISEEKIFLDYIAGLLTKNKKEKTDIDYLTNLCDVSIYWLRYFYSNISSESMQYGPKLINEILDIVSDKNKKDVNLNSVIDTWKVNQSVYSHSVLTLIVGLSFLDYLGYRKFEIKSYGLGILLHDIGMTLLPEDLYNKREVLTDQERILMKKHPKLGFKILKDFPMFDKNTLLAILQHHENCDGSGYPDNLKESEIDRLSRILRIVDSFTALISGRPWRGPLTIKEIISQMKSEWDESRIYDRNFLVKFIQFMANG